MRELANPDTLPSLSDMRRGYAALGKRILPLI